MLVLNKFNSFFSQPDMCVYESVLFIILSLFSCESLLPFPFDLYTPSTIPTNQE